eukprot:jgi/Psemu1/44648/gm1.44648_g
MFSQSKFAILLVVLVVAAVQGFAPISQPRTASTTELGAFFFQKPTADAGAAVAAETKKSKKVAPKKAPVKKATVTAKKAPAKAKKAAAKKASPKTFGDFVIKPVEKKTKLTIFERQCHIN